MLEFDPIFIYFFYLRVRTVSWEQAKIHIFSNLLKLKDLWSPQEKFCEEFSSESCAYSCSVRSFVFTGNTFFSAASEFCCCSCGVILKEGNWGVTDQVKLWAENSCTHPNPPAWSLNAYHALMSLAEPSPWGQSVLLVLYCWCVGTTVGWKRGSSDVSNVWIHLCVVLVFGQGLASVRILTQSPNWSLGDKDSRL